MIANFCKLWLIGGLLVLTAGPVVAQENAIAAFTACQKIVDNVSRLACFDAISFDRPAPVLAPVQTPAPAPAPAPVVKAEPQADSFGAETIRPSQKQLDKRPKTLTATLVETRVDGNGKTVFVLANGQQWHQIKGDSGKILLPQDVKGTEVIIKRKLLGSFSLRLKGTNNSVRVRRGR